MYSWIIICTTFSARITSKVTIHALEIGHGNMDDNDKDLSRSKRRNILGGWRYYQVYESKTPIGGSGRRIEVLVPMNGHLSVVKMRRVVYYRW